MAIHPCNSGFVQAAKFLCGEAPTAVFKYVAVGKGAAPPATASKLTGECTEDGLKRVEADTYKTVKTAIDNDTVELVETFTATTTTTVKEAGAFNNATIDLGDMLMVGDLVPAAAMVSGDTLKITLQIQLKAG